MEVLLVEDSPGDVRLTQEAFREANSVHPLARGVRRRGGHGLPEARGGPRPCSRARISILLDLNLPQDGWPRGSGSDQGGRRA